MKSILQLHAEEQLQALRLEHDQLHREMFQLSQELPTGEQVERLRALRQRRWEYERILPPEDRLIRFARSISHLQVRTLGLLNALRRDRARIERLISDALKR